jgi:hypothetical protein
MPEAGSEIAANMCEHHHSMSACDVRLRIKER